MPEYKYQIGDVVYSINKYWNGAGIIVEYDLSTVFPAYIVYTQDIGDLLWAGEDSLICER